MGFTHHASEMRQRESHQSGAPQTLAGRTLRPFGRRVRGPVSIQPLFRIPAHTFCRNFRRSSVFSKETVFYEKQSFSQNHARVLAAPGHGVQQRHTCIASKHKTNSGHSPSDSHCSTHKRSTLACANDTPSPGGHFLQLQPDVPLSLPPAR